MASKEGKKILESRRPQISLLDFDKDTLISFLKEKLHNKKILTAYLFGSLASDTHTLWSDIDIIIVKKTDIPFIERPREFLDLFDLGIPIDILVYTPEEFEKLEQTQEGFWKEVNKTKIQIF